MNLLKKIFSVYNDNIHKIICILGFKIKIRNYKKEINALKSEFSRVNYENEINVLKSEFNRLISSANTINTNRLMKIMPVNSIKIIELHIVDHCNLNCKGCFHFAPLAPQSFLSLSEFENDLTKLCELTNGEIDTFNILGGEPLLHPQCTEFLETARRIFPKSKIKLITNGILLPKEPDSFYEKCAKNNILLQPTRYNINIVDWNFVKKKCRQFGVNFKFYAENDFLYKEITDLSASQNPLISYLNCQLGWHEIFYLDHGKIYHCSKEAYIRFFSDFFKQDIKIPETDYIDIYKAKNLQEIYNFMNTPPKFCSHCIKNQEQLWYKWEKSQKSITEWT